MKQNEFVKSVRKTIFILSDPKSAFQELEKQSLESVVVFYMRMLLLVSLVAGIFNFLFPLLRAFYLDIFVVIDIQYWNMINYSISRSSSIIFFYLFAGTFIFFLISVLIRPFTTKLKYPELLKVLMYSMAPLLLFGWLPTPTPFIIWSLFLLIIGIKSYNSPPIKKDSIHNRT